MNCCSVGCQPVQVKLAYAIATFPSRKNTNIHGNVYFLRLLMLTEGTTGALSNFSREFSCDTAGDAFDGSRIILHLEENRSTTHRVHQTFTLTKLSRGRGLDKAGRFTH